MIKIQELTSDQVGAAKTIIASVAQRIFVPDSTPEDFLAVLEEEGELRDVDHFQAEYNEHRGLFLVVLDENKLVGTGAVKYLSTDVAELKRLWLLEDYHGMGIGFRVVSLLLDFARKENYQIIRLQTGEQQTRALEFYSRIGFRQIPSYRISMDNISMELVL